MPAVEIVVLANSRKLGGRCVAGVSMPDLSWIRPVSGNAGGELETSDTRVGGRQVKELDVIRVRYRRRLESPAQPENVLVDDAPWELVGNLDPDDAYEVLEPRIPRGPRLLENRGKAVPEKNALEGVAASLALVEPDSGVAFLLPPPEETEGKLKPRAVFNFHQSRYELPLTEYVVAPRLRSLAPGEYDAEDLGLPEAGRTLLTVSLAEPLNGWCTKLVAGVLFLPA